MPARALRRITHELGNSSQNRQKKMNARKGIKTEHTIIDTSGVTIKGQKKMNARKGIKT